MPEELTSEEQALVHGIGGRRNLNECELGAGVSKELGENAFRRAVFGRCDSGRSPNVQFLFKLQSFQWLSRVRVECLIITATDWSPTVYHMPTAY